METMVDSFMTNDCSRLRVIPSRACRRSFICIVFVMNTTASYSSEHSWLNAPSLHCSSESEFSIQGKETDYVRDTSDTDCSNGDKREYEPVTEPEDDGLSDWGSSGQSDNEIIATKVIEVSVGDDGDLQLADSEQTESGASDSEIDLYDYWECAQCRAANNNPLYRYCEKCFKVRKNLFPPRPKRKNKRNRVTNVPRTNSVDSGVESAFNSQEPLSQGSQPAGLSQRSDLTQCSELSQPSDPSQPDCSQSSLSEGTSSTQLDKHALLGRLYKRRAESADRTYKRIRVDTDSDSDSTESRRRKSKSADPEVAPLVKTVSDPALTVEESAKLTRKAIFNSLKEKFDNENLCVICYAEPKSAVFVHGRIAHICCCYECANKVWRKAKRCPQCNCKVSNVLKVL